MSSVDLNPQQSYVRVPQNTKQSAIRLTSLVLLLAVGIFAIYYPVHSQPFANYDDPDYVGDNFHVKAGLHWSTVRWAMTAQDAANWHPVTWLSHAMDVQFFGVSPAGPHDENVLLHLINALLLFWVLQRATGKLFRSWIVAALFAFHPINVESVAWIAERKNLLSMMFLLVTLAAYRWYTERPKESRYLLVAGLFALGLMAKPQIITLPFLLLLWDFWPLERVQLRGTSSASITTVPLRSLAQVIWEKVPLLGLCGISAAMTLHAQAAGGATSGYSIALRLENAILSYARYLGKAVWPWHLTLFYPYPLHLYAVWQVAAAAILLLAITIGILISRRRSLIVGWLWFLGTMVPMIGVVQVGTQAMADRYAYLPFVGLFVVGVWLVSDWAGRSRARKSVAAAAATVALAACIVLSHRQVGFWNDHITLWTHALEVTNSNWVAENNLGTALLRLGRPEDAIPHFRAAAAIYPSDPNSNLNIGTYAQMHGDIPEAIERYRKAAELSRNIRTKARAYNNLGYAYKDAGDFANARESLRKAVEVDPEFAGAWISLGLMAQRTGDLSLALAAYERSLEIRPADFAYLLLAQALDRNGQRQQADEVRQKAAMMSHDIGAAQHYADKLLSQ